MDDMDVIHDDPFFGNMYPAVDEGAQDNNLEDMLDFGSDMMGSSAVDADLPTMDRWYDPGPHTDGLAAAGLGGGAGDGLAADYDGGGSAAGGVDGLLHAGVYHPTAALGHDDSGDSFHAAGGGAGAESQLARAMMSHSSLPNWALASHHMPMAPSMENISGSVGSAVGTPPSSLPTSIVRGAPMDIIKPAEVRARENVGHSELSSLSGGEGERLVGSFTHSPSMDQKRKAPVKWSENEEARFIEALHLYGRDWKKCAMHVGSRDANNFRSHAQKYFIRLFKQGLDLPPKVAESGEGHTLSGKPLDPSSAAARCYLNGKSYRSDLAKRNQQQMEPAVKPGSSLP